MPKHQVFQKTLAEVNISCPEQKDGSKSREKESPAVYVRHICVIHG